VLEAVGPGAPRAEPRRSPRASAATEHVSSSLTRPQTCGRTWRASDGIPSQEGTL
jgi:hypothetical protein